MKRYDSYKDSEIQWSPRVPSHWKVERIKNVFTEKRSTPNSTLNSGSISFGEVIYKDDESITVSTKESYQELLEGEFLINPLNLNYDLKSLRIGLSRINVVVSQGYIILLNTSENNSEFLRFLLREFDVRHIKSLGNGVRQTISFKHLSNELIPVPPFSEQQQIVSFLDSKTSQIDELIQNKERKIELLKEYRTSLINQVVTKGLNPNVEMKDSGVEWIGEIPSHWEIKKIKHHSVVNVGLVINPSTYFDDNGTIPIITGKNVKVTGIDLREVDFITEESNELLRNTKIYEGDLVSMRVGYPGRTSIVSVNENGINCCSVIITRRSETMNSKLFELQLNSKIGKIQVELCQGGMGQQVVNLGDWNQFNIVTPPLSEQQQIVEYLDEQTQKIDSSIQTEERKIELLKEYRQSLISSVVTGKIDVRTN
jgi:type I restriction enzyme S subunit